MTFTQSSYDWEILEDGKIELKGQLLIELGKNSFSGTNGKDAVEHIENFLEVTNLIKFPYEPNNYEFRQWLASKFKNHEKMDWHSKNILWAYWRRGDGEENDWLYERNNGIPWVEENQWTNNEELTEPMNNICYKCISLRFKIGTAKWPTCNLKKDRETNVDSNYNPYLDISRLFNDHTTKEEDEIVQNKIELNYDEDDNMGHLGDHLVRKNEPFIIHKKEEGLDEQRCKLIGAPFTRPLACKTERFEVVKYLFGPSEKYIAIKDCGYYDWTITEENACHAYQENFHKMDEG
ncbi:hypothetical protein Tco_0759159 [Tanacetum coccineum]